MESKYIYIIAAVVLLVVILMVYNSNNGGGGGSTGGHDDSHDSKKAKDASFDKKGWIVFMREGCGWCKKQKEELSGYEYKFVDCSGNMKGGSGGTSIPPPADKPCSSMSGYPAWYNVNTKAVESGFKTIAQLNAL